MDDVFIGGQFPQTHGAPGMELLGGNAHFTAQTELAAVGKPGRGIDVHRRAVHAGGEDGFRLGIGSDDGFAVAGGVGCNVGHCLIHIFHALDSQNVVQEFRIKVIFTGRCTGDDGSCHFVQPQFYLATDAFMQFGQKFPGNGLIHQQHFLRVADTGAAGLGILDDIQGHGLIGRLFHIHMADTGAGSNAGHRSGADTGVDKSRAAPGDQQIDVAVGSHQGRGAGPGGILHQIHSVLRNAQLGKTCPQSIDNGIGAAEGLLAAPQDTDVAALQSQGCCVRSDVGTAFVDNGDDAHGNRLFLDQQAVRAGVLLQHHARGVRQGRNLPDALSHARDPRRGQLQPVQHHIGYSTPCSLQVQSISRQNGCFLCDQGICHGIQCSILLLGGQPGDFRFCRFCVFQHHFHRDFLLMYHLQVKVVPTSLPSRMA